MATIEERLPVWQEHVAAWRQSPLFAESEATSSAREAARPALLAWLQRLQAGTVRRWDLALHPG